MLFRAIVIPIFVTSLASSSLARPIPQDDALSSIEASLQSLASGLISKLQGEIDSGNATNFSFATTIVETSTSTADSALASALSTGLSGLANSTDTSGLTGDSSLNSTGLSSDNSTGLGSDTFGNSTNATDFLSGFISRIKRESVSVSGLGDVSAVADDDNGVQSGSASGAPGDDVNINGVSSVIPQGSTSASDAAKAALAVALQSGDFSSLFAGLNKRESVSVSGNGDVSAVASDDNGVESSSVSAPPGSVVDINGVQSDVPASGTVTVGKKAKAGKKGKKHGKHGKKGKKAAASAPNAANVANAASITAATANPAASAAISNALSAAAANAASQIAGGVASAAAANAASAALASATAAPARRMFRSASNL